MMTLSNLFDVLKIILKNTIMKTLIKSILLVTVVLLSSCNKSDDSDETSSSILEVAAGEWRLQSIITINGDTQALGPCENLQTYTFTNNALFTSIFKSGDNCGTTTQNSGTLEEQENYLILKNGVGYPLGRASDFTETAMNLSFNESAGETYYYVRVN